MTQVSCTGESRNESLTTHPTSAMCATLHGADFANADRNTARAAWGNPEFNQVPLPFGHGGSRPGAGRKPKPAPPIIEPEPEEEHWYCVCTKPGKDLSADIETRLAGFLVFSPTIWKPATEIRRDAQGIIRRGLPDRIEPLFRRYFFARFNRADFSWTKILHLPGDPVQRIISSTLGFPIAVPDSVIEAIQSRAHANGCLYPHAPAQAVRLPSGTRVRPVEGAFADLVGDLSEMSDGKRVRVLLSIMGRQVPVVMPQSAVEVVA